MVTWPWTNTNHNSLNVALILPLNFPEYLLKKPISASLTKHTSQADVVDDNPEPSMAKANTTKLDKRRGNKFVSMSALSRADKECLMTTLKLKVPTVHSNSRSPRWKYIGQLHSISCSVQLDDERYYCMLVVCQQRQGGWSFEKLIHLVGISIQVKIHKSQPNIYQGDHFPDHIKFPDFSLTFPVSEWVRE